jgi:hypothetical protein
MIPPPLPIELKRAEVRMAGNTVSVSAHGLTVSTELQPNTAAAMWAQLGARPGQVSITVSRSGVPAGAELIRLGEGRYGMRVWIGPMSFRTPIRTNYFEVLRTHEVAAQKERYVA